MPFFRSRGQWYQRGSHGCYKVNDGDPQNDVDDFDEDEMNDTADDAEIDAAEWADELAAESDY